MAGNSELEMDIARLQSAGADEQTIRQYKNDWAIANGTPTTQNEDGSPKDISFAEHSDLSIEPDDINPLSAMGAALSGLTKGVGGLLSAPIAMNEIQSDFLNRRFGWKESGGAMSSMIAEPFDQTAEAIKAWTEADTDNSLGLRYIENVADNVGPGAIQTKMVTKWGAKLMRALPAEMNSMQRLAVAAAKNPAKAQALEAFINTGAAVSGQTMYEMMIANGADAEEAGWWRMGAEISTGLGMSNFQRLGARIKDMAASKLKLTDKAREKWAERAVGKFFDEVMNADPLTAQKYMASQRVNKIYQDLTGDPQGLNLTTSQVTRQGPIVAAEQKLTAAKPRTAVEAAEHMRQQAIKTERFVEAVRPRSNETLDQWQTRMASHLDDQKAILQREIDDAVGSAEIEGVTLLKTGDPVALGNLGRQKLNTLREEYTRRVDQLYSSVENVNIPIDELQGAYKQAVATSLKGNTGLMPGRISKLFEENFSPPKKRAPPVGTPSRSVSEEIFDANFKDTKRASVGQLREFQKLVNEDIREAKAAGRMDEYRRLSILAKGIDNQFAKAERSTDTTLGKAATQLRTANEFRRQVATELETGEIRTLIAEDLQGLSVVKPEDFIGRFVRGNNEKENVTRANDFKRVFGDPKNDKNARSIIREAFLIDMRNTPGIIDPTTGVINTRRVDKYIQDHSSSIYAHGLDGEFDNIGSTAKALADIQTTNTLKMKDIDKSATAQMLKSKDPKQWAIDELKNGKYSWLRDTEGPRGRGYRQLLWEALIDQTNTGKTIGVGDTAQLIRDPSRLRGLLDGNKDTLKRVLGREHYNNLRTLTELMETVKPAKTMGAVAPELAKVRTDDSKVVGKVLSRLRAAYVFQSKELSAVQILNLAADSMNWKAAEGIMENALRDPEYARVLAQASRSKEESHAIRTIYSAVVAPLANLENEKNGYGTGGAKANFD